MAEWTTGDVTRLSSPSSYQVRSAPSANLTRDGVGVVERIAENGRAPERSVVAHTVRRTLRRVQVRTFR